MVDEIKISEFARKVYGTLKQVPKGRVTTYGLLARAIGCKSPRAIGQVLKKNPFAPRVPCHRVVRSDGTIGGFVGTREGVAILRKKLLLESEGIRFRELTFNNNFKVINLEKVLFDFNNG